MIDNYDDVQAFHQKFGLASPGEPRLLFSRELAHRRRFMLEELIEFDDAASEGNLVKAVDSLCDLSYVVLGTAVIMGVPWKECWDAVHSANMCKERAAPTGQDSWERTYKARIVKPAGWLAPDVAIRENLLRRGWRP